MYLTWQLSNNPGKIFTEFKELVANEYVRIVLGQRGPYVELRSIDIGLDIPNGEIWRVNSQLAYYVHYRAKGRSPIKVYKQLKTVKYADYKVGMFYISPMDLFDSEGEPMLKYIPNKVGQLTLF